MAAPLVEVVDVCKTYDGLQVLNGITFSLCEDEVLCVFGPSGCGKTTLFNLIAGLLKPERGLARCNAEFGYVFQDLRLLPWLTTKENVELPFRLKGQGVRHQRVRALLSAVGLEEYADYPIDALSGGMQQRAAIARALVLDPQVLLLDEPFRGLDFALRESIQDDVLRMHKNSGKSILMVSHELEDGIRLADRILVLSDKPSIILEEFAISEWKLSRQYNVYSPEFVRLKAKIHALLRPASPK